MKPTPLILFLLLSAAGLLSNCTQSGPCEGSLTLENPIPDTTVAVGDTLFIDLTDPQVFVSSEDIITYGLDGLSGLTNIRANLINNPKDNERNSLLLLNGISAGQSVIELHATSGCLENNITINITITES